MRNWKTSLAVVVVAGLMAVAALGQAAKSVGTVNGSVEDENGQPWKGVSVVLTNPETGVHFNATTDATGKYSIANVPTGAYTLTIDTKVYPPQNYQVQVKSGAPLTEDLNFQKVIKDNPKLAAELKKAKQFVLLKKHFEAGLQAMNQVKGLRQKLSGEAADQRSATQQQITQLSETAVTELQQAQKTAAPTDPNMPTILGNLALAYELSGKHDEAATTFTQAFQLKPTDPSYLQGAATNLAYSGKLDEASANCDKVTTLSPQSGGTCWRNIGVVLYNTNQMQKAVPALQKAAKADPSNPTTWYLLGEALMNAMQSKMVNGKLTAVVQPGTAEAFQKYLQLAPNGPQAGAAKQALDALQQLGVGVNTQFSSPAGNNSKK